MIDIFFCTLNFALLHCEFFIAKWSTISSFSLAIAFENEKKKAIFATFRIFSNFEWKLFFRAVFWIEQIENGSRLHKYTLGK